MHVIGGGLRVDLASLGVAEPAAAIRSSSAVSRVSASLHRPPSRSASTGLWQMIQRTPGLAAEGDFLDPQVSQTAR